MSKDLAIFQQPLHYKELITFLSVVVPCVDCEVTQYVFRPFRKTAKSDP